MRDGEELDEVRLKAFLQTSLETEIPDLEIRQFPAGSSNLTYSVKFAGKEFVLRRPPFGNTVKSAHDMSREFKVLSQLSKVYPPAPVPLIYCGDVSVIGSEFYMMERRHGLIVRGKWPYTENTEYKGTARVFIENLAELHRVDYKAAGLSEIGKPDGYVRRQVEGWSKRYLKSKTDELPEMERTIEWLNNRMPEKSGISLVHNDYKFDNIMLDRDDPQKIVAVLDWEMATIGDPLMDLGTTLGYWMSADSGLDLMSMPFNPLVLMERVSRDELVEMYARKSGREVSNINYYYVFGTFKIAVIAQQIYFRYAKGFTSDKRFAGFNRFVAALGKISASAIRTGAEND